MSYINTDFRTALETDMARLDMLEKDLGARLGVSQQSISKWKARNFPPLYRVKDLVAVLGENSMVAQLDLPNMLANTPRIRIAEPSKEDGPPRLPHIGGPRPSAVDRAAAVEAERQRSQAEELDKRFAQGLPESLRAYAAAPGPLLGARPLRTDYNSPKLALMHKAQWLPRPSMGMAPQILALAAARTQADAGKVFVLALVTLDSAKGAGLEQVVPTSLRESAKALGVEVWVCHSVEELLARISGVEGVKAEVQPPPPAYPEEDELLA